MHHGKEGITCSYWNMVWVSALEYASKMASAVGDNVRVKEYKALAEKIRTVIEENFWDEDTKQYAYFHDLTVEKVYYEGQEFTAKSDGKGGQYVFPKIPIVSGDLLIDWVNYSNDERAEQAYLNAKRVLMPFPKDTVIDTHWESMNCDQISYYGLNFPLSYIRLFYATMKRMDPVAEEIAEWLVENIPLAGVPEVFPTGTRAVQLWPCGEMLTALYYYNASIQSKFSGCRKIYLHLRRFNEAGDMCSPPENHSGTRHL